MIRNILYRAKVLLDITDDSQDNKLLLYIENALFMVRSYINDNNVDGLEPIIAQFVAHLYSSALEGAASSSSGSSSEGGGSITPEVGEIKKESYPGGISWEYTTAADFVSKSSSSSKSATSSNGDVATYFNTYITPVLRSRRRMKTLSHPYVEESPERY